MDTLTASLTLTALSTGVAAYCAVKLTVVRQDLNDQIAITDQFRWIVQSRKMNNEYLKELLAKYERAEAKRDAQRTDALAKANEVNRERRLRTKGFAGIVWP